MERVIGIDLGTTNCCVAVMEGRTPKVIPNKQGETTTPSVIAIDEAGERLVGRVALRQSITNPDHTVHAFKRLMGRGWDSPQVRHARQHAPFTIAQGEDESVRVQLRDKAFTIPELSAFLLQEMRVVGEDYLGSEVDNAVVTVPAYFNDSQRQAVRDAGEIAGLNVLRIINEPTAAALAYGFTGGDPKTIAVYDLGGGTFDISIVKIGEDGAYDVLASIGDSYLGGEDYDNRIVAWLLRGFEMHNGVDLRDSTVALQRIRQAAQKAKVELSQLNEVEINLPFIATTDEGAVHMEYALTRDSLEQLSQDLTARTLHICEFALKRAELGPEQIDEVVLVGGMTRMPAVRNAVKEFFGQEPCKGVHPDEAVAIGAAIQGAVLMGDDMDLALHDVTAHSLGIMTAGGGFDVLIPHNTTVPTRASEVFTTSRDNQDSLSVVVLQGESDVASENDRLGNFALKGLREAPAGAVEAAVTFAIDEDGICRVSAKNVETGEETTIEVTAHGGLSKDQIAQMGHESAEYLGKRRREEATERVRQEAIVLLSEVERLISNAELAPPESGVDDTALSTCRERVEEVRSNLDSDDINVFVKQLALLEQVRSQLKS